MKWPLGAFPTFLAHEVYDEDFFFKEGLKQDAREGDIIIALVEEIFIIGTIGKIGRFEQPTLFQQANKIVARASWADDGDQKSPDQAWLISRVTA